MNDIQFRSLDLNLFKVLLALLERRSVSAAAAELALTPSAVSHALGRLRIALGDPLFERRGGGLTPTPYALEIGRRAGPAIENLRGATQPLTFDPRGSERQFALTGGSYSATVLLPRLLDRLRLTAPRVRVRFTPIEVDFIEAVERGRVDIAFGAEPQPPGRLGWLPLFEDEMVWAARRDHPFVHAPLTMAMLLRARHVVLERLRPIFGEEYQEARHFVDEADELRSAQDLALEPGRKAASVSDLAHAFAIVCGSDAVTLTLRRYAEAAAPTATQLLTPPHPTPKITMGALFVSGRDAGVNWLLQELQAVA